jgi:hypothetical protein
VISRVIGIDPGPTTGIAVLNWREDRPSVEAVIQCNASAAPSLLGFLLRFRRLDTAVVIERFVISRHAKSSAVDGAVTRDLIGALCEVSRGTEPRPDDEWAPYPVKLRAAGQVKPWATDHRLAMCQLLNPTKAMPHARDAARHALFAAVADHGMPDPLSRRGGER